MIYELTYLINSQANGKKIADEIKELLGKMQLKLIEPTNSPFSATSKRLSYSIEHQTSAYYQTVRFNNDANNINGLEKELKFNKNIIRYLIVKLPMEALEVKKFFEKPIPKKEPPSRQKNKASIEELDKKLDEMLDNSII